MSTCGPCSGRDGNIMYENHEEERKDRIDMWKALTTA